MKYKDTILKSFKRPTYSFICFPRFVFLGLLFICLIPNTSEAQLKEVMIMYDSVEKRVKEKYFVQEENPNVLDGQYMSFYLDRSIKSIGYYKNNKAIGNWKYFFENGKLKMESDLFEDRIGGKWTYYFENGKVSQEGVIEQLKSKGFYSEDAREGNWNMYYEDNTLKAQAIYEQDEAWYREFYPSGELKMEGKISEGSSDSTWTYYYKNGIVKAKGEENGGLKEGNWIYYHPNGEKESEGTYENGQKNGPWKYFYSDGAVNAEGQLLKDQKQGFWKLYYNSGASLSEGVYQEGTGKYTEFYESGKVKVKGFVKEGVNDSTWNFFYEDGSPEGICKYKNGEGEYIGYHKDGEVKMKGTLKNGEKSGTWELYDEKGKLAGLYKTYYDKEEPIIVEAPSGKINEEKKKEPESSKPSYKFKQRRRISYFQPRINEYRSFILSTNPLQTLFGSFPISLEYYFQERLGYEFKLALIRDPFYVANKNVASDVPYQRGFFIELRQKFYFERNIYGLLYFGHEIRYSRSSYGVNLSDQVLNKFFKPILNEDLIEYSVVFGDRVMQSHANKGFTLDIWGGLGLGYRRINKNWTNIPAVSNAYSSINESTINVPIRIGITVGYVFKYNPSPLFN
jgi:uncharacterized protein